MVLFVEVLLAAGIVAVEKAKRDMQTKGRNSNIAVPPFFNPLVGMRRFELPTP